MQDWYYKYKDIQVNLIHIHTGLTTLEQRESSVEKGWKGTALPVPQLTTPTRNDSTAVNLLSHVCFLFTKLLKFTLL